MSNDVFYSEIECSFDDHLTANARRNIGILIDSSSGSSCASRRNLLTILNRLNTVCGDTKRPQRNYSFPVIKRMRSCMIAIYCKPRKIQSSQLAHQTKLETCSLRLQLAPLKMSIKIPTLQRKFSRLSLKEHPVGCY